MLNILSIFNLFSGKGRSNQVKTEPLEQTAAATSDTPKTLNKPRGYTYGEQHANTCCTLTQLVKASMVLTLSTGAYVALRITGLGKVTNHWFRNWLVKDNIADALVTSDIYKTTPIWKSPTNLGLLNGITGIKIYGELIGEYSGYSVSYVRDINGDQYDDVIIGAPLATLDNRTVVGRSYIERVPSIKDPANIVLLCKK